LYFRAIDRVHRLGQRRDVQVFRFTIQDTVEQQMLVIQVRVDGGQTIGRSTDQKYLSIDRSVDRLVDRPVSQKAGRPLD
jgi:SNF2 family DNA or RNA helicase